MSEKPLRCGRGKALYWLKKRATGGTTCMTFLRLHLRRVYKAG